MPTLFRATVAGDLIFDLDPEAIGSMDLVTLGTDTYHLLEDQIPYRIEVLRKDALGKSYRIAVNNRTYQVSLADDLDLLVDELGFKLQATRSVSRVEAPMPGLILSIEVGVGDRVQEGDTLLILEAMKMENAILSPGEGVVARIEVGPGDAVDKKSILIEFE